jgi:hypothetical protein
VKKSNEDSDDGGLSGPNLIPLSLRSRDNSGSGSGSSAWPKAVPIASPSASSQSVSASALPSSFHGRLVVGTGFEEDKAVTQPSGPLAVRGPIEEDWNTAVPVYGVNQGSATVSPPSLASSSSSSATSASDLLRDSYPLPTSVSTVSPPSSSSTALFPPMFIPSFSSFPSSSYQSSSIINYTTDNLADTLSNSSSSNDKPIAFHSSVPSSFSKNNYVTVNPAILLNRRISGSNVANNLNSNNHTATHIQAHVQNNTCMSDYRANTVINHTSNSTVYKHNDNVGASAVDDVTANPPSAEGFLSKYVRDIGLRARSLVGGLLKRDETIQVCVCVCVCACVCV